MSQAENKGMKKAWFLLSSSLQYLPEIFIYLFMRDTERERGRDTGRGRSRLHAESPTWDLILGLQAHAQG